MLRNPTPDVLVVGSGPVGSAYVRLLTEADSGLDILMVEAGPAVTDLPGVNLRNYPSETAEQVRAWLHTQGPGNGEPGAPAAEAVSARQGTYLIDPGGDLPAAALASCVGGQGILWGGAVPAPADSERIIFIEDDEWDRAIACASRLLARTTGDSKSSAAVAGIRRVLGELFDDLLPPDRRVGMLPVAGQPQPDGSIRWTGTDTILGDARFTLQPRTLCRRLLTSGARVTGAVLTGLDTGAEWIVHPRVTIVAADAIHTPQLLWASGIRPRALGHYLTEHPVLFAMVALRDDLAPSDPAVTADWDPGAAAVWVPFADPGHPFTGGVGLLLGYHADAFLGGEPAPNAAGFAQLGWLCRKRPRFDDHLSFSDSETDRWGMPKATVSYALTDAEQSEIDQALDHLRRAAAAIGTAVPGGEPTVLPPGTGHHYQGTFRVGDDGGRESVCNPYCRVWGFTNLFLGGNGTIPMATTCNTTLTSVALATRAVPHVLAEFGKSRSSSPRSAGSRPISGPAVT